MWGLWGTNIRFPPHPGDETTPRLTCACCTLQACACTRPWKAAGVPRRTTSGHQWSPRVRRRVFDAALAMGSKQRSHVSSNGMRASRHALCSRASSVRKWWQGAFFSTRTHAARLPMVTSLMPTAFSSGSSVSFDAHLWAVPHSLLRLLSRAADIISAYLVGQNGG